MNKIYLCLLLVLGVLLVAPAADAQRSRGGYHQVAEIPVGGEGGWDYLTVDSASQRLYISHATRVTVVDLKKNVVMGEISNTPGVHGIAIAPKLHRGFTSNGQENTVTVFDTRTFKEMTRIPVGTHPDAIIYDPATKRVFTFNGGSQDTTAIDAVHARVVGTLALDGRPEYAVTDERGTIFVNIEDKSEIVAFDARTLAIKHRWSLAPGDGPSGLTMDRQHRRLFAVCGNKMMVVMDADNGHIVATPTIGQGPDAAVFDPQPQCAFSSNGRDGTLTVIHEVSPFMLTVVDTVPTQVGARTMALDPKTHLIYLATARFVQPSAEATPPAAPGGGGRPRPQMEPNSFVILVFGNTPAPQAHHGFHGGGGGMGRHGFGGVPG